MRLFSSLERRCCSIAVLELSFVTKDQTQHRHIVHDGSPKTDLFSIARRPKYGITWIVTNISLLVPEIYEEHIRLPACHKVYIWKPLERPGYPSDRRYNWSIHQPCLPTCCSEKSRFNVERRTKQLSKLHLSGRCFWNFQCPTALVESSKSSFDQSVQDQVTALLVMGTE